MTLQKFFGCGGPPQTLSSSGRQEQEDTRTIGGFVERCHEFAKVRRRKREEWLLVLRRVGRPPNVRCSPKQQRRNENQESKCSFRFHGPDSRSAMNPAICCGNRTIPRTMTTAVQSNICPTSLPFAEQSFARHCCQKPKPKSRRDNPRNHSRYFWRNALAPAVPMAAAKAVGKQQNSVARELASAPTEAEIPDPGFTFSLPYEPRSQHVASSPAMERLLLSSPNKCDMRAQKTAANAIPLQCLVR
jgi:hypothetical protein